MDQVAQVPYEMSNLKITAYSPVLQRFDTSLSAYEAKEKGAGI